MLGGCGTAPGSLRTPYTERNSSRNHSYQFGGLRIEAISADFAFRTCRCCVSSAAYHWSISLLEDNSLYARYEFWLAKISG